MNLYSVFKLRIGNFNFLRRWQKKLIIPLTSGLESQDELELDCQHGTLEDLNKSDREGLGNGDIVLLKQDHLKEIKS